jgi:hypothetical protein
MELLGAELSGAESSVLLLGADTPGTLSSLLLSGAVERLAESSTEVEVCFVGALAMVVEVTSVLEVLDELGEVLEGGTTISVAGTVDGRSARNVAEAGMPKPTTATPAAPQMSDFFMMISCTGGPGRSGERDEHR